MNGSFRQALGHRQITTTEIYARVSDDALRAAVGAVLLLLWFVLRESSSPAGNEVRTAPSLSESPPPTSTSPAELTEPLGVNREQPTEPIVSDRPSQS